MTKDEVERFSQTSNKNGLGFSDGLISDQTGGYVRFSDYAALLARAEAAEAALKKMALRVRLAPTLDVAKASARECAALIGKSEGE